MLRAMPGPCFVSGFLKTYCQFLELDAQPYINAYHDNPEAILQVVDKITGVSAFKGTYNDTVWTEKWQAKL